MTRTGTIYGVGLGPGAPDLMSVRADRLVRGARHIAYFHRSGRVGHARTIVEGLLHPEVSSIAMTYPVTTEIAVDTLDYNQALAPFYDHAAAQLVALAETGEDVVVLCEGDPLFYGSFMHLHVRVAPKVRVEIVPGITGMSGCWTVIGEPVTWGDDVLTVIPGTLSESEIVRRLRDTDAAVIMKLGRNLPKVRAALDAAGLAERAFYVERGTMPGETVMKLKDRTDVAAPYFSMIIVHGHGRRPT
jgi:precorrin-2/cobalt-factor-2 C20-methyltransferase